MMAESFCGPRDRPATTLTDAAIEAAVEVLWASGALRFEESGTDHLLAKDVLMASLAKVRFSFPSARGAEQIDSYPDIVDASSR